MLMALDGGPTRLPASTVAFVYALAFVENCVLYAMIGVVLWPIAYFIVRLRTRRSKQSS